MSKFNNTVIHSRLELLMQYWSSGSLNFFRTYLILSLIVKPNASLRCSACFLECTTPSFKWPVRMRRFTAQKWVGLLHGALQLEDRSLSRVGQYHKVCSAFHYILFPLLSYSNLCSVESHKQFWSTVSSKLQSVHSSTDNRVVSTYMWLGVMIPSRCKCK